MIELNGGLGWMDLDMDARDEWFEELRDSEGTLVDSTSGLDTTSGDISLIPITLGINVHFGDAERADFYVGAFVAYVLTGDLELDVVTRTTRLGPFMTMSEFGGSVELDDELGFGGVLGVDVPFGGDAWMFTAQVRFMDLAPEIDDEADEAEELEINPYSLRLGFAYSF
jgi:outer membrane protein W